MHPLRRWWCVCPSWLRLLCDSSVLLFCSLFLVYCDCFSSLLFLLFTFLFLLSLDCFFLFVLFLFRCHCVMWCLSVVSFYAFFYSCSVLFILYSFICIFRDYWCTSLSPCLPLLLDSCSCVLSLFFLLSFLCVLFTSFLYVHRLLMSIWITSILHVFSFLSWSVSPKSCFFPSSAQWFLLFLFVPFCFNFFFLCQLKIQPKSSKDKRKRRICKGTKNNKHVFRFIFLFYLVLSFIMQCFFATVA